MAASLEHTVESDGEEELQDFAPPPKVPAYADDSLSPAAPDGAEPPSRKASGGSASGMNGSSMSGVGSCGGWPASSVASTAATTQSSFPPRNPGAGMKRGVKGSWGCTSHTPVTSSMLSVSNRGGPTAVFSPLASSIRSGACGAKTAFTATSADASMTCSRTTHTPGLASFDDPLSASAMALVDDQPLSLEGPISFPDFALRYAGPELRNNFDVVLASVKKNGESLEFASDALRGDKAVVMAAVQNNGKALRFASPAMQNDADVVLCAVENDHPNPTAAAQQLLQSMGIPQEPSNHNLIRNMIGYLARADHEPDVHPLSITDRQH